MIRSLLVVGAVAAVILILNYRAPQDPVQQIDPYPMAAQVAAVAGFPVLLPTVPGWRATAARWEPTPESEPDDVWYAGGVFGDQGPFASVSQSAATSPEYIAEQTSSGAATGTSATVAGVEWQRYESDSARSLVLVLPAGSAVVTGTGSWDEIERFAASLREVAPGVSGLPAD